MERGLWVVDGRIVESGPHIHLTIAFLVQISKIGTKKILPCIKSIYHISSKRSDISSKPSDIGSKRSDISSKPSDISSKRIDLLCGLIMFLVDKINNSLIVMDSWKIR
jgi:hypothetical protein